MYALSSGKRGVNLKVMGTGANIPLINKPTYSRMLTGEEYVQLVLLRALLLVIVVLLLLFIKTKLDFVLRATGITPDDQDNDRLLLS